MHEVRTLLEGRGLLESPRWLPDGRLLVVSSADGTLLVRQDHGTLAAYADLGRPGWNDIVADGRGNAYVNRAGFDPMSGEELRPEARSPAHPAGRRDAPCAWSPPSGAA